MLAESGGTATDRVTPEKGGAVRCWQSPGHGNGWSYIVKVNKVSVSIRGSWGNGHVFDTTMPLDKIKAVMSAEAVNLATAAGKVVNVPEGYGFYLMESREQFDAREAGTCEPTQGELSRAPDAENTSVNVDTFRAMEKTLKAGVKVVSAPQLFPTPNDLARRVVELGDIQPGHDVLEPSAGTGNLLGAMSGKMFGHNPERGSVTAIEVNHSLCEQLRRSYPKTLICNVDFLEFQGHELSQFDRILMNPPFENASDIKHIRHAWELLKPGGRLVAICANGSRQNRELRPFVEENGGDWEELPNDTFKEQGTGVRTVLLVVDKPYTTQQAEAATQPTLF
jgi:phospholipid N-methyltransferase